MPELGRVEGLRVEGSTHSFEHRLVFVVGGIRDRGQELLQCKLATAPVIQPVQAGLHLIGIREIDTSWRNVTEPNDRRVVRRQLAVQADRERQFKQPHHTPLSRVHNPTAQEYDCPPEHQFVAGRRPPVDRGLGEQGTGQLRFLGRFEQDPTDRCVGPVEGTCRLCSSSSTVVSWPA